MQTSSQTSARRFSDMLAWGIVGGISIYLLITAIRDPHDLLFLSILSLPMFGGAITWIGARWLKSNDRSWSRIGSALLTVFGLIIVAYGLFMWGWFLAVPD